ncbi:MAG: hypothetical protein WBD06_05545 [Acidobacteriaceae bacterium]
MPNSRSSGRIRLGCPNCRQQQLVRVAREGFFRSHVFPIFGFYPWQCAKCGRQYLVPRRAAGFHQRPVDLLESDSSAAPSIDSVRAR